MIRPWPKGQPAPNRGRREAWVGSWGTLHDGRSKLSREARLIQRELVVTYQPQTAGDLRRIRLAARYLAMIEMTLDQAKMNGDIRSMRRTITGLQAAADRQLAGFTVPTPLDVARAIQQAAPR